MSIVFAGLMCHAPIVIPEIAGDQASHCTASSRAMRELAEDCVQHKPELLCLISPHVPRLTSLYSVLSNQPLKGNLSTFGFPDLEVHLPNVYDQQSAKQLCTQLDVEPLELTQLDHGSLVPLHFLQQAGWQGQTLILGVPHRSKSPRNQDLGHRLRDFAEHHRVAIIASGDMSHRLIPHAPAGYHPQAHQFDEYLVDHIRKRQLQLALEVPSALRDIAAEDVIDSLEVVAHALAFDGERTQLRSYEGPFGVGYMIATLWQGQSAQIGGERI